MLLKNLFFIIFLLQASLWGIDTNTILKEAEDNYHQGLQEKKGFLRQENFNRALKKYLELEEKQGNFSGKLNFNIGNLLFLLGDTPGALLYYNRALFLEPGNAAFQSNLAKAEEKLGIRSSSHTENFVTFEHIRDLFLILFFISIMGFLIWGQLSRIGYGFLTLSIIVIGFLCYTEYSTSIEAILMKPTFFYRDPGTHYSPATNLPALAGTKVKVISITNEGKWLKVIDSNNNMGYVPWDAVAII